LHDLLLLLSKYIAMAKKKPKNRSQTLPPNRLKVSPVSRYNSAGWKILIPALMAVVVFSIYSNTLQNPFVLDDLSSIQQNSHIRITRLNFEALKQAGFESPLPNRPVAYVSFALNYYFHQLDVAGYHVLNILIHIACGILLYFLIKTTLDSPAVRSRSQPYAWVPFLTALIWLVHPIQTQSVTYLVQRMNSLAAMFYVLSILLYARARRTEQRSPRYTQYTGCIISGVFALGSKETAATLPVIIFLYEWYFQQDLSWNWLKRRILPIAASLALFILLALFYLDFHPLDKILNSYSARNFTLSQRVLTEFRVVVFYISLILLPHPSRLNLDHYFSVSHSLMEPVTTMLAVALLAGLLALALYSARRQRLISFCILWYLGNLVIESSVIGLEIAFEHRNYLPSMFFILMIVILLHQYSRPPWLKAGVLAAVVLVFCTWTFDRNDVWRDAVSLWQDSATKSPQKARPHNNFAVALVRQGNIRDAIGHYRRSLQIEPDYAEAHFNLATALRRQGKYDDAVLHYREMQRLKPDHSGTHNGLGAVLHEQGKIDQAIFHYAEALRLNPEYSKAHFNMGVALKVQGKTDRAVFHFREALRLDPRHSGAHYQLAMALNHAGKVQKAVSHFQAALALKPDHAEAHYRLGTARYKQGRMQEAVDLYNRALTLKPNFAQAHNDLGVLLYHQRRLQEAVAHYTRALSIKPDYAEAHNNIGAALDDLGRTEEGIYHYREALRLKPDYAGVHNNLGVALAMQGNLYEALKHFSEAVRIRPDDAEAHSNQANALSSLGRYEEATQHYHAALEISPNDAEVRRNLEKALKRMKK
jgi:tetratricopeptide (TPR) repeat protein